ncbi:MAG: deoxyguanosinetriphosphate triphosphohydrolase [Clostridiales bacterium]|nr:deoxyguanosinetriphosphate triphosphohydrolase [Clostridiales bacterium]MCF8021428.1 deoxyguanosinetriphosphate triphosphohydrolase [Clostridiales bacterium]
MDIRQCTESLENSLLSPYACLSVNTTGRLFEEKPCAVRTVFQRDRDRIIHSKSFRRLKQKTQVFIIPEGDHYRTRLTHTLEVAQIAKTISKALRLNEDLTEAIALGHDLGHTPFGHSGETALNEIFPGGFRHNEQSLRVVEKLEGEGGLNLTGEVKDGILNHTGPQDPVTLEGRVVKISDRIAYINHDIDDAVRGEILYEGDLPVECTKVLGGNHRERINVMVTNLIKSSWDSTTIKMSDDVQQATDQLRNFLFQYVYTGSEAKCEEEKTYQVIQYLYKYFINNPAKLPLEYFNRCTGAGTERTVCDYIAGMTDRYVINCFENLFIPRSFTPTGKSLLFANDGNAK